MDVDEQVRKTISNSVDNHLSLFIISSF